MTTNPDLNSMNRDALRKTAKELGISPIPALKADLIAAILAAHSTVLQNINTDIKEPMVTFTAPDPLADLAEQHPTATLSELVDLSNAQPDPLQGVEGTAEENAVALSSAHPDPVFTTAIKHSIAVMRHPGVKDKSPEAVASKVAQRLNRDGLKPDGRHHYTGKDVLALFQSSSTVISTVAVDLAPPPAAPPLDLHPEMDLTGTDSL